MHSLWCVSSSNLCGWQCQADVHTLPQVHQHSQNLYKAHVRRIIYPCIGNNQVFWLKESTCSTIVHKHSATYIPAQARKVFDVCSAMYNTRPSAKATVNGAIWINLGKHSVCI